MEKLNLNNNTRKITETAVIVGIMVVFGFFGFYGFPIINTLYPVPAIIIGVRHDIKYSFLSVLASSLIIGILLDILTGIFLFIVFGVFAVVLAHLIGKKNKPYKVIIGSTFAHLISTIIVIYILQLITGVKFADQISTFLNEAVDAQLKIFESMGFSNYEMFEAGEVFRLTINYIIAIIPSILIITSVFISYINYWISATILVRLGHNTVTKPKFIHFALPQNFIIGVGVIILATLALKYFSPTYYETVFLNLIVLGFFMFFLQGFAVILYFIGKMKINSIVKVILIVIILIYMPLSLIISLIGVVDSIFDFRKIRKGI